MFLPLQTRPLLILTAELGEARLFGARKVVPVTGGSVEGETLRGSILPGGSDWALTRADGVLMLDVRLLIETVEGAVINCEYTGMRHGPDEVMKRLASGETVDPSELYFRIAPRFETAHPAYLWLNKILSVGVGERLVKGPRYHIHQIC
jgi:hypothetical protein